MPRDTTFRLSTTLALSLACVCVAYAESTILPEVAVVAAAVVVSLVALLWLEKRVEMLTIPAANRLGLCLGVGNLIWAACRVTWELQHNEQPTMPWQLMLAAMFGPLLITAMPAKLARREKHSGDYWALHAMGLFAVCLAGAMAEDFAVLVLIVLYAIATSWSLALLHLMQCSGAIVQHSSNDAAGSSVALPIAPSDSLRIAPVLGLLVCAAVVALPLYLFTPASPAEKLSFSQKRMEIGFSPEQVVNLNLTGDLKANDSVAFEVTVQANGRPFTQLSLEQRWIGRQLREYVQGAREWRASDTNTLPTIKALSPLTDPFIFPRVQKWHPPELGTGELTLLFSVPASLRAEFLADPVAWAENQPVPIASIPDGRGWTHQGDGSFYPGGDIPKTEINRYKQVWRVEKEPDLSPPFQILEYSTQNTIDRLCKNPVGRVEEYARRLLDKMIAQGRLPADCFDPVTRKPRPRYHDSIATYFCDHLSRDKSLSYTTTLKHIHPDLDPVEDFLFHTKAGHCELFASALALMLRSQGIPAVLVLGFKGCEPADEPGKYVVRQQNAHVWVSALILEYEQDPQTRQTLSRWRSLDPTPSDQFGDGNSAGENTSASFFKMLQRRVHLFLFVYTPEQRNRVVATFFTSVKTEIVSAVAVLLAASSGVWLFRRRRRRMPEETSTEGHAWLQRLLRLLARHGLTRGSGETPMEFAMRTAPMLRREHASAILADLPLDWVEAYYEMRFGENSLAPARKLALEARFDELMRLLDKARA